MKRVGAILLLVVVMVGVVMLISQNVKSHNVVSDANHSQQTAAAVQSIHATLAPTTTPITFEVVTTESTQERGLGGRAVIPDNYAMLFVFPKDDTYGFWMKDMLTSIDMIWLADDGTIVHIDDSVPADSYPDVYYPPQPIKYVLETRAGFAREKGWKIDTKIHLPPPY